MCVSLSDRSGASQGPAPAPTQRPHPDLVAGARISLRARNFTDIAVVLSELSGRAGRRNVSRMLDFLRAKGQIAVTGRQGLAKLWDLTEPVLPDWTPRELLLRYDRDSRAAQQALCALDVAMACDITRYFTPDVSSGGDDPFFDL